MMARNLVAELEQQTQYPAAWIPTEPGQSVMGRIVRYSRATTKFGPCWVAWLDTEEGPQALWVMGAVLQSEFKRLKPKVSETIAVRFLGWSADRRYKRYAVAIDRPQETEPDFDAFPDGGDEPETYASVVTKRTPQPSRSSPSGARPRRHDPADPFWEN